MIDVSKEEYQIILSILKEFVPNCEIRVFGSRNTGKAKPSSDLDLAIVGPDRLDTLLMATLKEAFEESGLPFRVDVLDWHSLSEDFKKIIEKDYTKIILRQRKNYRINS